MTCWSRRNWLAGACAGLISRAGLAQTTTHSIGKRKMKTHLIGHHLIDLPEGFEALAGDRVELFFGLDRDASKVTATLLARSASAAEFTQRVRDRSTALAAEIHEELKRPLLISEQNSSDGRCHLLRSFEDSQLTHVLRSELFCRIGTAVVHLDAESYRVAAEPAEQRLLRIGAQIVDLATSEKSGRGFGIDHFLIGSDHDQEIGTLNFKSAAAPDVLITVRINALTPNPEPGLLARWDRNFSAFLRAAPGAPSTIRRGAVPIGGMAGDELLTKAQMNGRRVMKLNAESRRDKPGLATPLLSLVCDTEPVGPAEHWPQPVWSEDETIKIWEEVVGSIRLRPGSV
jgi:hypothetical protein